ncbi:MAG: hypothetical protein KA712_14665 [Myxococcales bacterium]|nr:hypothetical protein [Myxococcales bacterium]
MSSRRGRVAVAAVLLGLGASSCGEATPAPEVLAQEAVVPLTGLAPAESASFSQGRSEFMEAETAAQGLGPLFNGSSCAGCHNSQGVGGPGVLTVARAACRAPDGGMVEPPGGSLVFLFTTRPDVANASLPAHCTTLARRRTTSVLGLGLIESIPDEAILAASVEPKPPGVGGRVAMVVDPITGALRVGRLGWKAQHASLDSFAADAYRNEMGVTNEVFPTENAPGGRMDLLAAMDPTPDPEARVGVVGLLADFMRFSSPPGSSSPNADTAAGEALFRKVGCDSCHRPAYQTQAVMVRGVPSAALSNRDVFLYSDLLLHDVGTGDQIAQGAAAGAEFKTPALWGMARNVGLMHDGRAATVREAIEAHGKEATQVVSAFMALTEAERIQLVSFVEGL